MEAMVKKFQQKYKRVRDEMGRWDELQSRLLSQFGNASSIIERLEVNISSRISFFLSAPLFFSSPLHLLPLSLFRVSSLFVSSDYGKKPIV